MFLAELNPLVPDGLNSLIRISINCSKSVTTLAIATGDSKSL